MLANPRRHIKIRTFPLLLSPPAYRIALPTHCTTPPNVSMTKQYASEEFLSGLFVDDDSDDDSDFELDTIIHGGYSEGDSIFDDCRSQAVTITTFTASPPFETATSRTKRRMEQWGTQGFPEPSSRAQTRKITLSPPWHIVMLQGVPTNPAAT